MSFTLFTRRIIFKAISENIASSEDQLTVRNLIPHLDFDIVVNGDKVVYTNKKDEEKVMLLYQLSYVPKDASPSAAQSVRRPYSFTVIKNDNLVMSIQTIQTPNQTFQPMIEISKHDKISIIIEGYDGTAQIYLFGLVAEHLGANMNG
jgi:hypothetical protein